MEGKTIVEESRPFLEWLARWYDAIPLARFDEVFRDPERSAILVADLIGGFCREGPLASERVNRIVPSTVELFQRAQTAGERRFLLAQDTHSPDTPEFEAWPPHCIRGTRESEMVPELKALPFAELFTVIEKNSLSAGMGTGFERWLEQNVDVMDYAVTGDCTDLCTYNLALFVRMWANANNLPDKRVWVVASAVQTYDVPVSGADGGFPHPGDFIHMFFLYHMALNGIRVVSEIR